MLSVYETGLTLALYSLLPQCKILFSNLHGTVSNLLLLHLWLHLTSGKDQGGTIPKLSTVRVWKKSVTLMPHIWIASSKHKHKLMWHDCNIPAHLVWELYHSIFNVWETHIAKLWPSNPHRRQCLEWEVILGTFCTEQHRPLLLETKENKLYSCWC